MKKKLRTRLRRKRKELIQEILEARKGPRQSNKHRNKQMIMNMKKEPGEITPNREEILKICAEFYKSLYTQTVPTQCTMKSSPDTEEITEFTEEGERAIRKKNEKVTEFKYLGQTTLLTDIKKEEIYARIRATWRCFGKKNKEILQDRYLPISLKKQVMDRCVLPAMTYGCQT